LVLLLDSPDFIRLTVIVSELEAEVYSDKTDFK